MYLKSIEMQGFKSFANKMNLQFHEGITGIVGPNGSGKSNVADAVRWVLGEQSAKSLRGGNMQDVIFSGTETRKPLGYASVAITFDNTDHKLNIDFNEVTVTRRLYRSGESEYLLNGAACRLKDINELFYDTGIGKEGYSIIGQGQIDRILSGKPEERRELFDEAAGIVKFKRRKAATQKKLADEQQNLVRVTDILSELTRQLGPLERQSETARVYLKKKEELKLLDVNMFLMELERIREDLGKIDQRYEIASGELQETKEAFEQTKQEYDRLEKELETLDATIHEAQEQAGRNAVQKQQMEGQLELLKEQILALERNQEQFGQRAEAIRRDRETYRKEQASYREQQEELREQLETVSKDREEKEQQRAQLQRNIQEKEAIMEKSKGEIITLLNQRASTKGKLQRYDAMLEQIGIRKSALSQKILQLKTEEAGQESTLQKLQQTWQEVKEKLAALQETSRSNDGLIESLTKELAEASRQMEIGQATYHREESRLESLKNLTERYDGYGNSIRKVMEQKRNYPGIRGVVADLIQAEKQYETAIETALGGSIQNIVTDNETTAKHLIEYLKKGKFGRATFLPLTSMQKRQASVQDGVLQEPGVLGVASDLVSFEEEYRGMAVQLLGRTLVVDHIDHAIALGRKYRQSLRMVTLEGELLSPGGSMTGGSFRNNSNLLGRRREIEELEGHIRQLKKELDDMQQQITRKRDERNELRRKKTELTEQMQKLYLEQNTARMNMQSAVEKTEEIQSGYASLQREGAEIESQIAEITESRKTIEGEMELSRRQEGEQEEAAGRAQAELEQLHLQDEQMQKELEDIRLSHANVSQKFEFLEENILRISRDLERLEQEEEHLKEQAGQEKEQSVQKEKEIAALEQEIVKAGEHAEQEKTQMEEYLKKKETLNGEHKEFFRKRDELSEHIARMDKECYRLNSQKEKLEEARESQNTYMWQEYEITPVRALEYRMEELPERGEMKRQIAEAKEAIRKLGPVNVNAIEEYKELRERHEFLSSQHEDLVQAAKTLQGIIDELDEGMRRQFTEKFAEIRQEFDKAFKQLFGGGRGTLELMEDEDVLEAGIRIISQPPGKKLQNMMQLSGGEKALTAIALLFAIQNLKPSPFCLLDEIEAALDDSNVTRFATYLHKLTRNTQFIVITHRRGTMNAADRLYGITMQEKGVSTLVSVSLIEGELDK